jgi:acetyl esterase/lipase
MRGGPALALLRGTYAGTGPATLGRVITRSVESYGSAPSRSGEWFVPADGDRLPVVVLVHGGFWQPGYDRHLEDDVAQVLAADGFAVWNIDYAPASWPNTFGDAAAGLDHVALRGDAARLDLQRVAVVGHSAGGHLALWLASRGVLPPGAPGGAPAVRVKVAVAQAPVADLVTAVNEGVGGTAVLDIMSGDPEEEPDHYAVGSPQALLPVPDVRFTLVHGDADDRVPLRQSTAYVEAARALGMQVELRVLEGVGHFEHLDPDSSAVAAMRSALADL